jgi:hypothetical protein
MAHPAMEAADTPAPVSVVEKAAAFEDFLFADEADEDEEETDSEDEADEAEDELEDEQDDEADEPEAPAIDAPVSLTAEEKATFAQLPPEAQAAWAASETRRNVQVQEATTKASNAQREAEARAAQADAEAKSLYAEQLAEVARAYAPQEPNRNQYRDDVSYLTACRAYDQRLAQHNNFMQQVQTMHLEAHQQADAAFIAQRDRDLMAIPEVSNPETREAYLDKAMSAVDALGYDKAGLARSLTAQDVRNLAQIADWRAKAEKLDQATARQMQKVRASKGKTLRPNAAPQGKSRAANSDNTWQRVKQANGKNRDQRDAAMADWFEQQGHI